MKPNPRDRNRLAALFLAAFTLFAGCATTPDVGVRPDFGHVTVQEVTLLPTYSIGGFGLSPTEVKVIERSFDTAIIAWLKQQGFAVIRPDDFQAELRSTHGWEDFQDGLRFDSALETYFEPRPQSKYTGSEVEMIKTLYAEGKLSTDVLLLSEVVYQSEGTCHDDPTDFTPFAEIVGAPESSQCIVSHFQAKLVDARTGATMWYNRRLREYRGSVDPEIRLAHIIATVDATLGGASGMASFVPHRDQTVPTRGATSAQR